MWWGEEFTNYLTDKINLTLLRRTVTTTGYKSVLGLCNVVISALMFVTEGSDCNLGEALFYFTRDPQYNHYFYLTRRQLQSASHEKRNTLVYSGQGVLQLISSVLQHD